MKEIPIRYLVWHYTYGLPHLFALTWEFSRFVFNLFSIRLFMRTLVNPLFSLAGSVRQEKMAIDMVSIVVGNMVMRMIGFAARSMLIATGLAAIACVVVFMSLLIVLWTSLPLLCLISAYLLIVTLKN